MKIFAKKEEKNEKFIEREGDGGKLREKLIKSDRGSGAQIESARNRRRKSLIEIARTGHLQLGIKGAEHRTSYSSGHKNVTEMQNTTAYPALNHIGHPTA